MRLLTVLALLVYAEAHEHSFIDVKKVIRDALDVVASMPTNTPQSSNDVAQQQPPQSLLADEARRQLSRIFHVPSDFVHRLAAQSGYLDYDPSSTTSTTMKPWLNTFPPEFRFLTAKASSTVASEASSTKKTSVLNEETSTSNIASTYDKNHEEVAFVQETEEPTTSSPSPQQSTTKPVSTTTSQQLIPLLLAPVQTQGNALKSAQNEQISSRSNQPIYYQPIVLAPSQLSQQFLPQIINSNGQTYYLALPQAQLQPPQPIAYVPLSSNSNLAPILQKASPTFVLPSNGSPIVTNIQTAQNAPTDSDKWSVEVPQTERQVVFESEAKLHLPRQIDSFVTGDDGKESSDDTSRIEKHSTFSHIEKNDMIHNQQSQMQKQVDAEHQTSTAPHRHYPMNKSIKSLSVRTKSTEPFFTIKTDDESIHHPLKQIRINRIEYADDDSKNNLSNMEVAVKSLIPEPAPASADFKKAIQESLAFEEHRIEMLRKKMTDDRKRFGSRKILLESLRKKPTKIREQHKQSVLSNVSSS
ncbi:unnamed protein product [Anisakis simplex]|uniref:Transcription initiation factor TFIID subunit 8 (inferred by orthology to a human protein) n=1 Tax=Anisakis simplex TaxID=6269 RepID=A0A0M3JWJ5_ANISI|nr:unnamed protein product [Anisakis simplex]